MPNRKKNLHARPHTFIIIFLHNLAIQCSFLCINGCHGQIKSICVIYFKSNLLNFYTIFSELFLKLVLVVLAMPFIEYTPDEPYPDYRTYALLIFSVYKVGIILNLRKSTEKSHKTQTP